MKLTKQHGSIVLIALSGIGLVATAVSASVDTWKFKDTIQKHGDISNEKMIKLAIPAYSKTIIFGAATIGCMIGAGVTTTKNKAAVVGAYTLAERAVSNFKSDIYTDEMADSVDLKENEEGVSDSYDDEIRTFYDQYSSRYFESTMHKIWDAEYLINRHMSVYGTVNLNMLYKTLGMDPIEGGYTELWSRHDTRWIDFETLPVSMDDGMQAVIFSISAHSIQKE